MRVNRFAASETYAREGETCLQQRRTIDQAVNSS